DRVLIEEPPCEDDQPQPSPYAFTGEIPRTPPAQTQFRTPGISSPSPTSSDYRPVATTYTSNELLAFRQGYDAQLFQLSGHMVSLTSAGITRETTTAIQIIQRQMDDIRANSNRVSETLFKCYPTESMLEERRITRREQNIKRCEATLEALTKRYQESRVSLTSIEIEHTSALKAQHQMLLKI
ncbi:hypothetical protein BGW38_009127, partial [Lunasporangiospora selenospora]